MTVAGTTDYVVRQDGDDNYGGGFNTAASGTDRSNQASSHATLSASSTVNATTTIIDVAAGDYTCTDADVGNILQVHGGTATAGFYEITARSGQQWTMDRAVGTVGQTVVGDMGGSLATPGAITFVINNQGGATKGQNYFVRGGGNGDYTLTTSVAGKGGPVDMAITASTGRIVGYSSTITSRESDLEDDWASSNRPRIDAGAVTTISIIKTGGSSARSKFAAHIIVDGNGGASINGFEGESAYRGGGYDCEAVACTTAGFNKGDWFACKADGCADGFFNCLAYGCWSDNHTAAGFDNVERPHLCIASNGTGSADGFQVSDTDELPCVFCTAYNNGGDGFAGSSNNGIFLGCLSTDNGAYGFDIGANGYLLVWCAAYNNDSGDTDTTTNANIINFLGNADFSANPMTDPANDDFSLNDTAGAGALLRAVADCIPGNNSFNVGMIPPAYGGGAATNIIARYKKMI